MASCETEGHLWPVAGRLTGGALYLLQGAGVVDLLRVQALACPTEPVFWEVGVWVAKLIEIYRSVTHCHPKESCLP